jgi:formylmethanofuran dehydrogenase subunit D
MSKIMKAQIKEYLFQGLVGEASFSIILPIDYAVNLGIAKGDFVKVRQEEGRIVIEKVMENWKNGNC